jgi:hypothetical protein
MLIVIPVRLWHLSQKRNKVVGSWLLLVKLVGDALLLCFFQFAADTVGIEL